MIQASTQFLVLGISLGDVFSNHVREEALISCDLTVEKESSVCPVLDANLGEIRFRP